MDASTVVFIAALVTAAAGALAGFGGLLLARQQASAERAMRERLEEVLAQATGGDSFVYLEPLRRAGKVRYFVRQAGDHPTFDVVVRIEEVSGPRDKEKRKLLFGPTEVARTLKRGSGFDWTYPDPTPSDRREWPLIFFEPPTRYRTTRQFRIELAARNGIFVQRLGVWPVADHWHSKSKDIERAGLGHLNLPDDFNEAQDQDADGNRLPRPPSAPSEVGK